MRRWIALAGALTGDRDRLLRQPVRERLMRLIGRQPGIHASEICRETGEAWGTVQYHLGLLQDNALVSSLEAGRERRFFPQEMDPRRARLLGALHQGRREQIARYIQEHPGQRQVDVCKALSLSRKTFRASVSALIDAGLVQEQRGLQTNRYFPESGLADVLEGPMPRPPPLGTDLDVV